ncbi:MAG: hypothetical protein LBJ00_13520 [Planctomycetaceae bacterium]|nr:hypothetical protein [Planctomycetaceae bacterium]
MELVTRAQQREAVFQGRSLSPYRLRYRNSRNLNFRQYHFTILISNGTE